MTKKALPWLAALLVSGSVTVSSTWADSAPARRIDVTAEKSEAGKALFAACGACHGATGEGKIGMGPRLNSKSFLAAASDDFLVNTITNGRAGTTMIPWGAAYQPEQIESIVAYLRSMNPVGAVDLDHSPASGSAQDGEKLFQDICASCHGRSGAGYQETANGTGIGRKVFLDTASNGYLRYIIKNGKTNTGMRGFDEQSKVAVANLTDDEIENVIAYLREQAW